MDISKKDIDAVIADVAALKRDFTKALENFKNNTLDDAVEQAQDFAEDLTGEVAGMYKNAKKRGQRQLKAVSRRVEDQPIASLLVAFSVGFVVSRLLSR